MPQSTKIEPTPIRPIAVTVSDAIKLSSLCRSVIYAAMADGRLEARKVGKRTLVIYDSLETLIKSGDRFQSKAA